MRESVIYQEILEEGVEQGKQEALIATSLRQLTRRIGTIEPQLQESIRSLSLPQLEELTEALLDFTSTADLTAWLQTHQ